MPPIFHSRLVNGPFDDPGLFVSSQFKKRALLFDLGEVRTLSTRDLLKISHIFISHAHMDHFIGFDHFLRIVLGRNKTVRIFGPKGIIKNIQNRLGGYSWNLLQSYENILELKVTEITEKFIVKQFFSSQNQFKPQDSPITSKFNPIIVNKADFLVRAAVLDHRIPCLAFCLKERFRININKEKLNNLGLSVGPWIAQFKEAIYQSRPEAEIDAGPTSEKSIQKYSAIALLKKIAIVTKGQKIGYITDVGFTQTNVEKIVALVKNANHLYIEAPFLNCDKEFATKKFHLTAGQAGQIAKAAGVKKMNIFHFSPRYSDREKDIYSEAMMAFKK